MTEEWLSKYQELIDDEREAANEVLKAVDSSLRYSQWAIQELEKAQSKYITVVDRLDKRRAQIDGWKDDPLVWVKQLGPKTQVYHSTKHFCGWAYKYDRTIRDGYVTILLGEAKAQGLRPCSSCRYTI